MSEETAADEVGLASSERLALFSDAVVAIAITLLALGLPVPKGATVPEFLSSFAASGGVFVAFLISLGVIAGHWTSHHRLFRYVVRIDGVVPALNVLWLFLIVILPLVTRMLSSGGATPAGPTDQLLGLLFAIYAAVQVLAYGLALAMVVLLSRR